MGSLVILAAAPFVVRRFIEPAVDPRAAVWVYFGLLMSLALAALGLSVFLLLLLAPHSMMGRVEAACRYAGYCLHALPSWIQFTLWPTITALLGLLVVRMGWTGLTAVRASRRVRRAVIARATPIEASAPHPVYEAADPRVFAWTVGLRRPLIVVSQGLRESLPPEELAVVLAHEEAHASSHDNMILLISRIIESALFFVPGISRASGGVRRCVEISADASASRGTGDRLLVAASVSRVARLLMDPARSRPVLGRAVGAAFAHGELVVERVQHLVGDRGAAPSRPRLVYSTVALALALVIFGASLYSVAGNSLTIAPRTVVCAESVSK